MDYVLFNMVLVLHPCYIRCDKGIRFVNIDILHKQCAINTKTKMKLCFHRVKVSIENRYVLTPTEILSSNPEMFDFCVGEHTENVDL